MEQNEFEKYLKIRYQDQINWYDKKSQKYKKYYYLFQSSVIALSAATPVLIAISEAWNPASSDWGLYKWGAIIVSALVAIGTTLLKTFKYQETWISYRTTCETLKKELHYYNWQIGEYGGASKPKQLFVERVESLLSQENTMWLSARRSSEDKTSENLNT